MEKDCLNLDIQQQYEHMRFLKRFAKRPKYKSYEEQKKASQSSHVLDRFSLAKETQTNKEILYYLAEHDTNESVRIEATRNPSTPVQVMPVLAVDPSQDVRLVLAGRLVELLPDVSRDQQSQLYAYVVQALGTLALDEVLTIRKALSSTLKDHAYTPPKIAGQLARDIEREVSEPILRFCAALSDGDLIDILKEHPEGWVIEAIADRETVSEPVSHALITTDHRPAGVALINNQGANLTENILSYIVEKSKSFTEWQKPIALRGGIPASIVKALAEFVDASVRDILLSRGDFDPETTEDIAKIFRRRVDLAQDSAPAESLEARLEQALKDGKLNEDLIYDAVGMRDSGLAYGALAHLSGIAMDKIEAVIDSGSAKSIIALCWKAGLSMRLALHLQKEAAHIPPKDLIYPSDGSDYPLSVEAMETQIAIIDT